MESRRYRLSNQEIADFTAFHNSYLLAHYPTIKEMMENPSPVNFIDDKPFLKRYTRIVVGAHGPYVEFDNMDVLVELTIPRDQMWRGSGKYKIKYHHYAPVDRDEKIYYQVAPVDYADYKVYKMYIDFYQTNLSRKD